MAVDLTGGMEPSKDFFLAEQPEDPQFRESASFWVSDYEGLIGLPRVGIEAVSESWAERGLQLNLGFPDGRTAIVRGLGEGRSPLDDDGICRTFAAGGLAFKCVEPFKTLTMTYDGTALDTRAEALAKGDYSGQHLPLEVEVELTCAAPPWISGSLTEESAELFNDGFAGDMSSSARHAEQSASVARTGPLKAPVCEFTGRDSETWGGSGDTVGRAHYFRAERPSERWRSRSALVNPHTTKRLFTTEIE
jgi:hypothetical protein